MDRRDTMALPAHVIPWRGEKFPRLNYHGDWSVWTDWSMSNFNQIIIIIII